MRAVSYLILNLSAGQAMKRWMGGGATAEVTAAPWRKKSGPSYHCYGFGFGILVCCMSARLCPLLIMFGYSGSGFAAAQCLWYLSWLRVSAALPAAWHVWLAALPRHNVCGIRRG